MIDEAPPEGVPRVIYRITYPNGKIYIGQDITNTLLYFGSVNRRAVLEDATTEQRYDFSVRKEILWESYTATLQEVNRVEREIILASRSNDPAIGYNRRTKYVTEPSSIALG